MCKYAFGGWRWSSTAVRSMVDVWNERKELCCCSFDFFGSCRWTRFWGLKSRGWRFPKELPIGLSRSDRTEANKTKNAGEQGLVSVDVVSTATRPSLVAGNDVPTRRTPAAGD